MCLSDTLDFSILVVLVQLKWKVVELRSKKEEVHFWEWMDFLEMIILVVVIV